MSPEFLQGNNVFCLPHRAQNPGHDAHPQWSPQPESLHAPFSCRCSAGYHTHRSHSHDNHNPVAACKCSFNGHLQHWAEVTGEPSALVKWSVIKLIYWITRSDTEAPTSAVRWTLTTTHISYFMWCCCQCTCSFVSVCFLRGFVQDVLLMMSFLSKARWCRDRKYRCHFKTRILFFFG